MAKKILEINGIFAAVDKVKGVVACKTEKEAREIQIKNWGDEYKK